MAQEPAIVHITGYPASGKLTVATALGAHLRSRGREARVVDNHYVNDVIFGLIDVDGVKPVAREVWDRVREVRRPVLETVRTLAPSDWTFIFTNYVVKDQDEWVIDELASLAHDRGSRFLFVRLECEPDELCRRIAQPDRRQRLKWKDPAGLRHIVETHRLADPPPDADSLTIDTGTTSPDEAATLILDAFR
jgi:tRNA uridine 5-carbamoylmethylation protein Kti12